MYNNNGTYGPNEPPTNMISSINRPQSTSSNINHNLNDFGKIVQQAASTASGHYEAHNLSNYGSPHVGAPRIMHPFQPYQTMGHSSTYYAQNSPFNPENAIQDYFPAVSTTMQTDHHKKLINFHQNFLMNMSNELATPDKESVIKGLPLNIPQIPSRVVQQSPDKNDSNPEVSMNLSRSTSPKRTEPFHHYAETKAMNNPENLSLTTKIGPELKLKHEQSTVKDNELDSPKNLSRNRRGSSDNTPLPLSTIQETSSNNSNNSTSTPKNYSNKTTVLDKSISDKKRKSLEKTVRLIESILIKTTNNNTKPDIMDDKSSDPLAFSPKPNASSTDTSDAKNGDKKAKYSDSDDEVLIKKVPPKGRKKPPSKTSPSKKIESTRRSHVIESETEVQCERRMKHETENIIIKAEYPSLPDYDYGNPFHRDSNGMPRNAIGDGKVVEMDTSMEMALDAVKNGTSSLMYYECPHCLLLLFNPKRFLIHTKWHSFGLLNEKRAEIAREREDRTREKREARLMQRLMATEAKGVDEEDIFPCKDCDKAFTARSGLKNHRRKFHPTEVTECKICYLPVHGWKALQAHMAVHKDKEAGLHQCPNCPKRFKYRHSLSKHADTHLEKTHACPECSKMFGSVQLVKMHMKTHERMARGTTYHCSYCGKGFYETYNLNVHERTHRNDKPFKCDICESCFVTNSSLKRHVKVSHGGAKPFTCEHCHKCFSTENIRDRHALRVHCDQRHFPFPCTMCPKRYMKTKDLKNHMYKMHSNKKRKRTVSKTKPLSS